MFISNLDLYRRSAVLPSFGAPAAGKYVKPGETVQGDTSGSGTWATIPTDQYYLDRLNGVIYEKIQDDSRNGVDFSIDYPGGTRSSYTIDDNGTLTNVTNESITFADEDDAVSVVGKSGKVQPVRLPDAFVEGLLYAQGLIIAAGTGNYSKGPNNPGALADDAAVGTVAWSSPSNAQTSDDSYAFASSGLSPGQTSHYLKATNFGFAIPNGATILGVLVEIERVADPFITVTDSTVKLVKAGAVSGNNKATATAWPTSDAYASYGGSNDLWGVALTPADVNASNFGVVISATCTGGSGANFVGIDHIRITVFYTLPTGLINMGGVRIQKVGTATALDDAPRLDQVNRIYDRVNSDVTVGNTITETNIYSKSIAANDLGANGGMRLSLRGTWLNNTAGTRTLTLRFKFGATTIVTVAIALTVSATTGQYTIEILIFNTATNAQRLAYWLDFTRASTTIDIERGPSGTAAEDTTAAKTFAVTAQWDAANANATLTNKLAFLEVLR